MEWTVDFKGLNENSPRFCLTLINLWIKRAASVVVYETLVYVWYGTAHAGPGYKRTHQLGVDRFGFLDLAASVAILFDHVTAE
jgi:hypothetical protein